MSINYIQQFKKLNTTIINYSKHALYYGNYSYVYYNTFFFYIGNGLVCFSDHKQKGNSFKFSITIAKYVVMWVLYRNDCSYFSDL